MWQARVIGSVTVLALGIATIFFASQLPYQSGFGPGPGFLPFWIGIVLVICSAIVTVQEMRAANTKQTFFQPRTRTAVKMLAINVVAFLLIPVLGFSVGFGLFILATMRMMGKHGWAGCVVAAVLTVIGIHYLFGQWLDIPLPTGFIDW